MSWDEFEYKYGCPCGNETYTVLIRENDWFQQDESWTMDCSKCSNEYELYQFRNRHNEWSSCWINKDILRETFEEQRLFETLLNKRKQELIAYARSRYQDLFISKFKDITNKKNLRRKLIEFRLLPNISESYFYKLSNGLTTSEYLSKDYFEYEKLLSTLAFMNIEDYQINIKIRGITEIQQKIGKLLSRMLQGGHIGRMINQK